MLISSDSRNRRSPTSPSSGRSHARPDPMHQWHPRALLHWSPSRVIGQTRAHEISPMPSPPPGAKIGLLRVPVSARGHHPGGVGWYLRFGLSYRDVQELLAERGIEVDHVSVYRWV